LAGHSKWANIKHKKQHNDASRQLLFGKLSRSILSSARRGGAGETNLELAARVAKAREANMPKKTIDALIKRVGCS